MAARRGLTSSDLSCGTLSEPSAGVGRIELAMAPSSPATMYAQIATSTPTLGALLGVYKTTDAGTTWTRLNTSQFTSTWGTQLWYDNTIRVSPVDPNVVWAGG